MLRRILLLLCFHIPILNFAQNNLPLPSSWQGELPSTKKYLIAFEFKLDTANQPLVVMHSPGEGSFGIKCKNFTQKADSVFIDIPSLKARLEAKWNSTEKNITGRWLQGTIITPITLVSNNLINIYRKEKYQTPKPPYNYISEDVEYDNADKSVHLAGTITKPNGTSKFPAILLITGSGQQDRNSTVLGQQPFAVLADYLTKKGYLVLRVDDRGVGKSKGDLKKATSADFAKDAETSLDFLLKRTDVDIKKIGLMGHSEGGLIAQIVAAKRKEINFVVSLAGPSYAISDLMTDQNKAVLVSSGYSIEAANSYGNFYKQLVTAIFSEVEDSLATQKAIVVFKNWQQTEKKEVVSSLTAVPESNTPEKFVKAFMTQLRIPWWKFFWEYDPALNLTKIKQKYLAINGSKDIQVNPKCIDYFKKYLPANRSNQFMVIDGLNHLFQSCNYCVVGEYGQLKETFSPKALEVIGNWLKKEVQ
jgi:uncharacterized protein